MLLYVPQKFSICAEREKQNDMCEREREAEAKTYRIDSRQIFEGIFVVAHLSSSRSSDLIIPHHPTYIVHVQQAVIMKE